MMNFFVSVFIFFTAVFIHRSYYLKKKREGKKISFNYVYLILLGVIPYMFFGLNYKGIGYFWSGFIFYLLSTILHSIYFTSPYLGDKSPSSIILKNIEKKKKMTHKQIYDLFSESDLVEKRLGDLNTSGLIMKLNDKFYITSKGKITSFVLSSYRKLFGWQLGG